MERVVGISVCSGGRSRGPHFGTLVSPTLCLMHCVSYVAPETATDQTASPTIAAGMLRPSPVVKAAGLDGNKQRNGSKKECSFHFPGILAYWVTTSSKISSALHSGESNKSSKMEPGGANRTRDKWRLMPCFA